MATLMGVPIPFGNIGQVSQELWAVAHSASSSTATDPPGEHDNDLCQEPYLQALTTNAAQVKCLHAACCPKFVKLSTYKMLKHMLGASVCACSAYM